MKPYINMLSHSIKKWILIQIYGRVIATLNQGTFLFFVTKFNRNPS